MEIIHGENVVASRDALFAMVAQRKKLGHTITTLSAKKITQADLEEALGSQALFVQPKTVVIEQLHSLPTSKKKKELLSFVAKHPQRESIVLWEKRALTKTMLKQFSDANSQEYKLKKALFTWLDSVGADSSTSLRHLENALTQEDAYLCFVMLCSRVSALINLACGGQATGAPFMISKLRSQARNFTKQQLFAMHETLFTWDIQTKTGKTRTTLPQLLETLSVQEQLKGA